MAYFNVTVAEVRSGDDLVLMVNLGVDDLFKRVRARLKGVDTPDAYKAGPDTEAGRIREEVRRLTKDPCHVIVREMGKNGWVVDLYIKQKDQEIHLNDMLRGRGYVYTPREVAQ